MPQPFPSQLMVGFVATYAGGELKVDADEPEDARWFPGDALPARRTGSARRGSRPLLARLIRGEQ